MDDVLFIGNGPVPRVFGRGRPKGSGGNLRLLARMRPGDCVFDVPTAKMQSIRSSAWRSKIPIKVRRVVETGLYTIFKEELCEKSE